MPRFPSLQEAVASIARRLTEVLSNEIYARVEPIPMLSHYTSLDAFTSILRTQTLWFSLVRDMNDTSEVIEGADIIAACLDNIGHKTFTNYRSFNTAGQFAAKRPLLESDTFVLSLCEHGSDALTDRLIMWQAYGFNGNGLCLVLRKDNLLKQKAGGRFPVHWAPIDYETPEQLAQRVEHRMQVVRGILEAFPDETRILPPHVFGALVAGAVGALVLSHKNVHYAHEKELRFVRSRLLQEEPLPTGAQYRSVSVNGKVKSIFELPLRHYPEFSINAEMRDLLDHVIVGPSHQQQSVAHEVRAILDAHAMTEVPIVLSSIPYRATR